MTIKTVEFTLPAHWAAALINDDMTGCDDGELEIIRSFTGNMIHEYGGCHCLGADTDNSEFTLSHNIDADGALSDNCCTFTFEDCRLDQDQVKAYPIGSIDNGCSGSELYFRLDVDGGCTNQQIKNWLLARHYREARRIGDSFCHLVKVIPVDHESTEWIGVVYIQLDV